MLRIGHRGAAALAPENTIESVRAAVAVGVDGVEFDVRPDLVVRHDRGRGGPKLADFLAEVREVVADDALLIVDLKRAGTRRRRWPRAAPQVSPTVASSRPPSSRRSHG